MRLRLAVSACAVCVLVMSAAGTALAAPPSSPGSQGLAHRPVCPPVSGPYARCDSQVRTHSDASPLATATYTSGYAPADLMSAYKLPAAPVSGAPTVAIVDAYDAPSAEADLGVYRAQFGLADCTTANGCFRKVNQRGVQNAPPAANSGWAQEISLDLDMVSAICPACHILLVEADSNSYANLGAAVNMAASMGATQISNSYGGSEGSGVTTYDSSYYNHPGIDVTVSSGDNGYGVEFPASSPHVTAVGGTSLSTSGSTRGWSESAWSGAGSGCSAYFAKPSWQTDTGCARRTVADVSAVADPNTGVAVYDSYPSGGQAGWMVFGGTSVASPIVAAVDALAGGRAANYGAYPYTHHADFFDISGGSNGTCTAAYLCNAVAGYDGPTGVGTPNGAGNTPDGTGTPPPPPPPSPDFTITASPSSQLVHRTGSVTYTVTLTPSGGWTGPATLSASGVPSGTTATWDNNPSSGGNSHLNVTVSSTQQGNYPITITAADGTRSHSTQVTLQVKRK